MNCQDLARILSGRGISRLTDVERMQFRQHLSSCEDCARDWELQSRLMAQPVPAMPATLETRCRAAVVSHLESRGRRRESSRLIFIGTILAVAAAAAILALIIARNTRLTAGLFDPVARQRQLIDPMAVASTQQASDASTADDGSPYAAGNEQEAVRQKVAVLVMPLVHNSKDIAVQAAVEKHYMTMIQRLRSEPDLMLVETGSNKATTGVASRFRITVTSNDVIPDRPPATGAQWKFEFKISKDGNGEGEEEGELQSIGSTHEGLFGSSCAGQTAIGQSLICLEAGSIAVQNIEEMRLQRVPLEPSLLQKFRAQLSDARLPPQERFIAFVKLRSANQKSMQWDATSIRAIDDLLNLDPEPARRAEIWRALRGIKHPELARILIRQMGRETNASVREAAATTLTEEFGDIPEVRTTLELLQRDSQQRVRQLAEYALCDDKCWRKHVLDALNDAELSHTARIAPLRHMSRTFRSGDIKGLLEDEEILVQLAQLLPRMPKIPEEEYDFEQDVTPLITALGSARNPLALGILLEVLEKCDIQLVRIGAAYQLSTRLGVERVRKVFERIADSDPDVRVRSTAEEILNPLPEH